MADFEIKDGVGIIPEGTTKLDWSSFEKCTELTSIVIPDSVTKIEDSAFEDCTGLTSIVIPKTIKKMGYFTFQGCTSLKSVTILAPIKVVDDCFKGCKDLETVTLGTGIKQFDENVFEKCTALKTIIVPAKKSDYYLSRLPESLHALVVEQGQDKPVKKTQSKKKTPTKTEMIEKLDGCKIGYYVNMDLSGFDEDMSADELPNVLYHIENGKLLTWDYEEIMDMKDIIYEDEEEYEDEKQVFHNLVTDIIDRAKEVGFSGCGEFADMFDNEWILLIVARDKDDNTLYEINDYNIAEEL